LVLTEACLSENVASTTLTTIPEGREADAREERVNARFESAEATELPGRTQRVTELSLDARETRELTSPGGRKIVRPQELRATQSIAPFGEQLRTQPILQGHTGMDPRQT
jgi:hypothetical protein